jgi:EmrB/QacA subfamily drug resistance transporter
MTAAPARERIEAHVWRISAVVIVGSIMSILDTTIVNVALDTLARELHSTIAEIQWVVTGYMLALGAVIPVTGWAARRFGAKRVYLVSLVLFVVGSALCGLATSTTELVIFRVLQGLGGGMILPIGQLMMAEAAGPERMGRVMSVVAVPAMLAPIFGPAVGGLLLDNASWRWIFFINVPIGVIAVIAALRSLPNVEPKPADRLDVRGLLLLATGLPLIIYGLSEIGISGTFSVTKVLLPCVVGVALVGLFAYHALRVRFPLLDLRLYRRPTFSAASIAMFCLAGALFGGMILIPLYWQQVRHLSVVDTGLLTAPQGLGAALAMPFAGRIADRYGGGPLALFGVTLTAVMTIPFALVGAHTSIVWLSVAMLIRGVGIGCAFMPAMTAAFASLQRSELSHATPQLNVLQRVGGSLGTAVLAVVLSQALVGVHTVGGAADAFGEAFWWATGITALAIIPCIVLARAERAARARGAEPPPDLNEEALAESLA